MVTSNSVGKRSRKKYRKPICSISEVRSTKDSNDQSQQCSNVNDSSSVPICDDSSKKPKYFLIFYEGKFSVVDAETGQIQDPVGKQISGLDTNFLQSESGIRFAELDQRGVVVSSRQISCLQNSSQTNQEGIVQSVISTSSCKENNPNMVQTSSVMNLHTSNIIEAPIDSQNSVYHPLKQLAAMSARVCKDLPESNTRELVDPLPCTISNVFSLDSNVKKASHQASSVINSIEGKSDMPGFQLMNTIGSVNSSESSKSQNFRKCTNNLQTQNVDLRAESSLQSKFVKEPLSSHSVVTISPCIYATSSLGANPNIKPTSLIVIESVDSTQMPVVNMCSARSEGSSHQSARSDSASSTYMAGDIRDESVVTESCDKNSSSNARDELIVSGDPISNTVIVPDKDLQCPLCASFLDSRTTLINHLEGHSSDLPDAQYICTICAQTINPDLNLIIEHMKDHFQQVRCKVCDRVFANFEISASHRCTHTLKAPLDCSLCGNNFSELHELEMHPCSKEIAEFVCRICGRQLASVNAFNIHIEKHAERLFACKHCDRKYISNESVKIHAEDHSTSLTCPTCGKILDSKRNFEIHNRYLHSVQGKKTFHYCDVCFNTFADEDKFVLHKLRHKLRDPPKKLKCKKKFSSSHSLKKPKSGRGGVKKQGSGRGEVKKQEKRRRSSRSCSTCGRVFLSKEMFEEHKRLHRTTELQPSHSVPTEAFDCNICKRSFPVKIMLDIHEKKHDGINEFICEICDKVFRCPDKYLDHWGSHTSANQYACELCDKTFCQLSGWQRHRRKVHAGAVSSPYVCELCGKTFLDRGARSAHHKICKRNAIAKQNNTCQTIETDAQGSDIDIVVLD